MRGIYLPFILGFLFLSLSFSHAEERGPCFNLSTHYETWQCLYDIERNSPVGHQTSSFDLIQRMCRDGSECDVSAVICNSRSAQSSTAQNPRVGLFCSGSWVTVTFQGHDLEHMECNDMEDDFRCGFEPEDTYTPAGFHFNDLGPDENYARSFALDRNGGNCIECHSQYSGDRAELNEGIRDYPLNRLFKLRQITERAIGSCDHSIFSVSCDPKPRVGSLEEFYCALKGLKNRDCYERAGTPPAGGGGPSPESSDGSTDVGTSLDGPPPPDGPTDVGASYEGPPGVGPSHY